MGGTSTDVARIDNAESGVLDTTPTHRVGEAVLLAPAVNVESVAAGGGSVCGLDEASNELTVGPRSAGAAPGPACYGAGGPLTVTDVNLLSGRIDPGRFGVPVDAGPARERLRGLHAVLARAGHSPRRDDELLDALLAIANDRMASAIRRISVRQGYDPARFALVGFGGAGPQHACAVADALGMTRVVVPADCSLLSAAGLAIAAPQRRAVRQVLRPLDEAGPRVERVFADLARAATDELRRDGETGPVRTLRRTASLRYAGQHHALEVDAPPGTDLALAFAARSREVFGHELPGRAVEVESLAVVCEACGPGASNEPGGMRHQSEGVSPEPSTTPPAHLSPALVRFEGRWVEAPRLARESLVAGEHIAGPALIVEDRSVTVVEPGWEALALPAGDLLLERRGAAAASARAAPQELLTGRLHALGEEMGERLRRTALSTNVKERLDYSCALLDAEGRLIVSAPHVPVHLGALGLCVRRLIETCPMNPGDVVVTNHPAFGGSHLPDVTVVAPAHDAEGRLLGYAACRAHHAEIGGSRPGSMPPGATTLAEEGVVIAPTFLVRGGSGREDEIRRLLYAGPFPTRALEENLADLSAQVAALRRGVDGLAGAARDRSPVALAQAMASLRRAARTRLEAALAALGDFDRAGKERLDDGRVLRARIVARGGRVVVDLSGSPSTHPGNLNAPLAVVHSVVMYVLRLLLGPARTSGGVPLNDGLLEPAEIIVPAGMLNPGFDADPSRCPAVAAGNVETSQRLVNLLVRTLGLAADSQGTMNNVIFGDDRFGYYETICGGAGAGPGFAGASAVHTHMTNTAITDPEVLEQRYPVRLDAFCVRRGSGGVGARRGGDGVSRHLTFLRPLSLSVITQHRVEGPAGLDGGAPGAPGAQRLVRAGGSAWPLGPSDTAEVSPGDRLIIETPGGGGWGRA
jgi:5-oxoprolinase (ATP-hydrolysing)